MFNATILEHFERPRNAGELPAPALRVEATNPVCGDILHLWLLVEAGCIREMRFKAKGCVAAIASASMLTEMVRGKNLEQASHVSSSQISAALGGLPPESGHAAELAEQALKAALQAALAWRG
ncbi:MAG: iron-sulfur cluster assembly scaffold protein [Acidobacteria bacterium]|nr:iron-sulfur cluster assembly scaffold protein [Acidobacteriota bacterium]